MFQKMFQNLWVVTIKATQIHKDPMKVNRLTLNNQINNWVLKSKRENKKTDQIPTRNPYQTKLAQKILLINHPIRTIINHPIKKMMTTLLMKKFKFKRRLRCKIKRKLRMIWMQWKEQWEMKRIKNSLHSRKKLAISLSSKKRSLLHTWLQLKKMLNYWRKKVS